MISWWKIYLITRCGDVKALFFVCAMVAAFSSVIALVVLGVGWDSSDDDDKKCGKRILKFSIPIAVVCALLATLTPTTKEAIAMISIPAIANSQLVQQDIPEAVRRLWRQYAEREDRKEEERK